MVRKLTLTFWQRDVGPRNVAGFQVAGLQGRMERRKPRVVMTERMEWVVSKLGEVVWRLPPLDLLERMSRSSVLIGVVSIAIGTALGFIWVDRLTGQYWYYDPKYVVTILVLVLYAAYLRLARTTTWRGARASRLCIFNFVVVILSFTVVNLYLSHSHRYF